METDKEMDARHTMLLVTVREGLRAGVAELRNTYGDVDDVGELAESIEAFFAERLYSENASTAMLCMQAEEAYKEVHGKNVHGSMSEDGLSVELRSLDIPDSTRAIIAHGVRIHTEIGITWLFHKLPQKDSYGNFCNAAAK